MLKAGAGLDENGFIISDVHQDKIAEVYLPVIKESISQLKAAFGKKLYSVYVYGSVARGDAVIRQSDLDLIALFKGSITQTEKEQIKEIATMLSNSYQTLVRDVGIALADYEYTLNPENLVESAFLKELCVCVYGNDLVKEYGPYALTAELASRFNGDIKDVLIRTINRLDGASNQEFQMISKSFARKLIRTYYSMVMLRSQIWTTRLYEQADVFTSSFPEKKPVVQTLLTLIEGQATNREDILLLLKQEGEWARDHFLHEAHATK